MVDGTSSLLGIAPGTGCIGLVSADGLVESCAGAALGPGTWPSGDGPAFCAKVYPADKSMIRASGTSASARLAALTLKFGTLPPGAAWATPPNIVAARRNTACVLSMAASASDGSARGVTCEQS